MSSRISPQDVLNALRVVKDPDLGRDIVTLGFIKNWKWATTGFRSPCNSPRRPARCATNLWRRRARRCWLWGLLTWRFAWRRPLRRRAPGPALIPQVKYTIAVASGKGGVGKSTVAANLAVALQRTGAKVGLMDTDVYGPSVPILMGGNDAPYVVEGKIEPPVEYGIKIMSMAYFLPKDEAVIWRGPMLHKTIQQFLGDVRWGELDYLIMDLPPGTGDIQLSLSQTIPLTGAVIVSTPQDLALTVASKAIAMFQKLNVPILGIVENMSYYRVPPVRPPRRNLRPRRRARGREETQLRFPGRNSARPVDSRTKRSGKPVALDDSTVYGKAFQEVAGALAAQISIGNFKEAEEISIE